MTPAGASPDGPTDGFSHEALFYAGTEDFVAQTAPFVREGVARDEAVLVVLPRARLRALEDELGEEAERVTFLDMALVGANPARFRTFSTGNVVRLHMARRTAPEG